MGDLFDLENGITAGILRLGIAQGGYVAYVEVADSGAGFRYFLNRDGVRLFEGNAPDFRTAKQKAEEQLRLLCSVPSLVMSLSHLWISASSYTRVAFTIARPSSFQ